jgi:hypothetical protein
VDRDKLRLLLRLGRLGKGDGENTVSERSANLVLVKFLVERYPPLEMAVIALIEPPAVFPFFSPSMVSILFDSSILASFSSRPGSSAITLISLPVYATSICGQVLA